MTASINIILTSYNDYRPHQRLGSLTPNQAEAEYYEALFEAESTVQVKSENNSEE